MADTDNDYTLGRGKLYFDQFAPDTLVGSGERYIGNTPSLVHNSAYQNLEHFSSDYGVQDKDASVQVRVDRAGSFTCDNISPENVAIMFGSDVITNAQSALTGEAEHITVTKGRFYQLGADDSFPDGLTDISSVTVNDNTGAHASGTMNFNGNPSNGQTITINGVVITFVTGTPSGNQVQIGGTAIVTAQAVKEFVNDNPHTLHVTAAGSATLITLTAIASGTGGNSITLARSGSFPTVSGATLSGGTASGIITAPGNYEIDTSRARLHILEDSNIITNGQTIEVVYNVLAVSRTLIVDKSRQVEGALRFNSDNPEGTNKDYYWPRVKLTPNGDVALKSDGTSWMTMGFNFEVLKKSSNLDKVYVKVIG